MRMVCATAIALGLSLSVTQAEELNCDDTSAMTQSEMNMCASMDYQEADAALNAVWPVVKAWATVTDNDVREWQPELANAEENLLKAQRAWIDYRDGHCESEGMKFAGGSIQPMIVASCKADLTRKRTEELFALMKEF